MTKQEEIALRLNRAEVISNGKVDRVKIIMIMQLEAAKFAEQFAKEIKGSETDYEDINVRGMMQEFADYLQEEANSNVGDFTDC